ncbi:MAG: hypothetical protein U0T32_02040 [Chitinophagales bacterium]
MEKKLLDFISLKGRIVEINSDNFIYEIELKQFNIEIITSLYDSEFIEQIKANEKLITIDKLHKHENELILLEFITSEFKKIGYFLTLKDFILCNRFQVPAFFHIEEISYSHLSHEINNDIEKYRAVTALIEKLTQKAKFVSDVYNKTICLIQDNSFIEIQIETIVYEELLDSKNTLLINQYLSDIESYKEKRTIFLKELIDFLSTMNKGERFSQLILLFGLFYDKCNTSFEYYLSANFSFNKINLNWIIQFLEYSKT